MTCFNMDELEKNFKKMKFLVTKDDHILQYICDKNNKHEEMLKMIRDIRNKKVLFKVKTVKYNLLFIILFQTHNDPYPKELLELPKENLIKTTQDFCEYGKNIYNFLMSKCDFNSKHLASCKMISESLRQWEEETSLQI